MQHCQTQNSSTHNTEKEKFQYVVQKNNTLPRMTEGGKRSLAEDLSPAWVLERILCFTRYG